MQLTNPVIITPRLLAGVKIGDSFVSIEYSPRPGRDGRTRYRFHIDTPDFQHSGDDLQSGCQGGDLREGLESLLSFLGAAAEAYRYSMGGRESDNLDMFDAAVNEWAYQNDNEITMAALEVQECADCIRE